MPAITSQIKQPYQNREYSEEEILEFARCIDDPHYFLSNFFFIQHPTKGKMVYEPYDYQTRLINIYHNYRFNINMLPRQTGKSTTAAGYLLWYAMFVPDSTILIAAHKYTGAKEIMQRIRYAYEMCPDYIRAGVTSYNKESIEFENGSRIVAQTTTETTGRGMAISLLYADEFAFVPPNIAEEFWTSIYPTLTTGGKAIITSTPNSDEDQFAILWKEANKTEDAYGNQTDIGINGFKSFTIKWNEPPGRDEEWAVQQKASIGEERFRREYNCEFLIFDETLINSITLSNMQSSEPVMKMGEVRWYKKVDPHATYVVSLDPSLGTGGDFAGIQVLELPSFIQVAEWHHNATIVQEQVRILRDIVRYINDVCVNAGTKSNIYYSVENNTIGEAALMAVLEYGEETFPGLFMSEPIKKGHARRFRKGFNTSHPSKISACSKLKHLVEHGQLKVNSASLITQLKSFVAKGASFSAKSKESDDLVTSLLLCIRMSVMLQEWDPSIYLKIHEYATEDPILPMPIFIG